MPICPHCEQKIEQPVRHPLKRRTLFSVAGTMFSCPSCDKVLGLGMWAG